MKSIYKRLLIFEFIMIILLFVNNFVSSILGRYIEVILLGCLLTLFYFIFRFERDRHHLWKSISIEILIFLLVFFILYYVSGMLFSFAKTNDYYSFQGIFMLILPMILVIILKEVLRYMILCKAKGSKLLIIITCIIFILLDVLGKYNAAVLDTKYTIFVFIGVRLLPIISKNILCSYLSYHVGYKPVILYLLITELYGFLIPIIPNPNQYLYSVIWLIVPFILLYKLYLYLKKEEHDEVIERNYHKKRIGTLVVPLIIVIFLVYITSGYFHYHAIVIASGSMEKEISKGDVVIVEKIDGNIDLLKMNQVIAYKYNGIIVVHRLVKKIIVNDEPYFYTKGDANNEVDSYKITKDMIIGIVEKKIPYIGYPTIWVNDL